MTEFFIRTRRSGVRVPCSHCRTCCARRQNARYHKNPEAVLSAQRAYYKEQRLLRPMDLHKYGISSADYLKIWNQQGGLCAICHQPERCKRRRWLAVDHDHDTNRIRGLLCDKCNVGIGCLGDDVDRIASALDYLNKARMVAVA